MTIRAAAGLILCAAACAQVAPPPPEEAPPATRDASWTRVTLAELGLADAQRYNTQPTLSFPFLARGDRVLSAVRVSLAFAAEPEKVAGLRGLQILVNQETVATLGREDVKGLRHSFAVDPQSLLDKNQLTLRLLVDQESACGKLPEGIWRAIRSGEIEIQSAPLPLPNQLSLLPLPFIDRAVDRAASVPVVLPREAPLAFVALAARLASSIGVDNGMPLTFPVSLGELPDASAVVLADAPAAAALGLPTPAGPSVRMMDHPRHPRPGLKLLVISGRTLAEVELAVSNVVSLGTAGMAGESMAFTSAAARAPAKAYEAPRWLSAGTEVRFDSLAAGGSLEHLGMAGGRIAARFRIPPDVWIWPEETLLLDLSYLVAVPPGTPPPRLDAVFNGRFLATLPALGRGERTGSTRVRIHRSLVRGYNELDLHVSYAEAERACAPGGPQDFRVALLPDSVLHLEDVRRYASLPDVALFVEDGFPFTRVPDLRQAAAVLAQRPTGAEVATLLSAVAQMGQVTGTPSVLEVLSAEDVLRAPGLDRDLLLVGLFETHALLRRWADRAPIVVAEAGGRAQLPAGSSELLTALSGFRRSSELEAARSLLASTRKLAAVTSFASPLWPGRNAVAITATSAAELPSLPMLQGFASSRDPAGDLLVLSGGRRSMFRIGPSHGLGELPPWTALRWFVANHVLLLLPALFIGILCVALPARAHLSRRARERLDPTGSVAA